MAGADWLGRPTCGPGSGSFGASPAQTPPADPFNNIVIQKLIYTGDVMGAQVRDYDTNACFFRTVGASVFVPIVGWAELHIRNLRFQVIQYYRLDGTVAVGPEFVLADDIVSDGPIHNASQLAMPAVPADAIPQSPIRIRISWDGDGPSLPAPNFGESFGYNIYSSPCDLAYAGPNGGADTPCPQFVQTITVDNTRLLLGAATVIHWTITNTGGSTVVPISVIMDPDVNMNFESRTFVQTGGVTGATAVPGSVNNSLMMPAGSSIRYDIVARYPNEGEFWSIGFVYDHVYDFEQPHVYAFEPIERIDVSAISSDYDLEVDQTVLFTFDLNNTGNVPWRYQVVVNAPDPSIEIMGRAYEVTVPIVTGQTSGYGEIYDYVTAQPAGRLKYYVLAKFTAPGEFRPTIIINGHTYTGPLIRVPPLRPQNTLHASGYRFDWYIPPGAELEYIDVEATVVWDAISPNGDPNPPIHLGVSTAERIRIPGAHPHSDFGLVNSDSVGAGAVGLYHTLRFRVHAADIAAAGAQGVWLWEDHRYLYMVLASRRNLGDKWRLIDRRATARWCLPAVCLEREAYQGPVQVYESKFVACPVQRRVVQNWTNPFGYDRVAPYVELYSGSKQLENFEIRFWPNQFGTPPPSTPGELAAQFCIPPCFVIRVPCLPAGASLRIDGAKRRCDIRYPGSVAWEPADDALEGFDAPFVWDEFDCVPLTFAAGADYASVTDTSSIRVGFQGLSRVG